MKNFEELIRRLREANDNPSQVTSWRDLVVDASDALDRMQKALAEIKEHAEFSSDGEDAVSQAGIRGGQLSCIRDILSAFEDDQPIGSGDA